MNHRKLRLYLHPFRLTIRRLPAGSPWASVIAELPDTGFQAVVRSADSVTLVHETTADTPAWRAMEVAGSFAFSETGILAALAEPLAAAGVSLFAVNSFETDFVLVQEADLERAAVAVSAAGHSLG